MCWQAAAVLEYLFDLVSGSQGTLFVLSKDVPTAQMLLEAIEDRDEPAIVHFLDQLVAEGGGVASPAESTVAEGCWRLVWSAQVRCLSGHERVLLILPCCDDYTVCKISSLCLYYVRYVTNL